MKILHIHNQMIRKYGNFNSTYGRKFNNGFIKNNHQVVEFSDRDLARFEAPFHFKPLGKTKLNQRLLETCANFKPDALIIGHSNLIELKTFTAIRSLLPNLKIGHWNLDALWIESNVQRLAFYSKIVDAIFLTTGGDAQESFRKNRATVSFIPNPADASIESENNATKNTFANDLLYCGVGTAGNYRYDFLKHLNKSLGDTIRFKCCGLYGDPPVWGQDYLALLKESKMGLNLNSLEDYPLYSSDRIAQLMGNGVLTFLWDKGNMRRLFNDEQVVFFNSIEELREKITHYHLNDAERQAIAQSGHAFYHQHYSSDIITQYMIETLFGLPFSQNYFWLD
jgi:hypothetical protein